MKTLCLPPYGGDVGRYLRILIYSNNCFCDTRDGRWLFFDNGETVIVVDTFGGLIHELKYSTELSTFIGGLHFRWFIPQTSYQSLIISREYRNPNSYVYKLFQVCFDYETQTVNVQRQMDLLVIKMVNEFYENDKFTFVEVCKDFLMIAFCESSNRTMNLLIYNLDNLFSGKQPKFTANLPVELIFGSCLIDNLYYYFDAGLFKEYAPYIGTFIELSKLLYCYDFDTKSNVKVELQNDMSCIIMDIDYSEMITNSKTFTHAWFDQYFFACISIAHPWYTFHNALLVLDLKRSAWRPIELPTNLIRTGNPLKVDINKGILIFTNTHIRNPTDVVEGDFSYPSNYSIHDPLKDNSRSYVYRMAMGRSEKLRNLAYFFLLEHKPKVLKLLNM